MRFVIRRPKLPEIAVLRATITLRFSFRNMLLSQMVAVLAMACSLFAEEEIPNGTAVPIQLSTGLNARKDRAGKQLSGRVMQDVALPTGEKIKSGSRVLGHILQITRRGSAALVWWYASTRFKMANVRYLCWQLC